MVTPNIEVVAIEPTADIYAHNLVVATYQAAFVGASTSAAERDINDETCYLARYAGRTIGLGIFDAEALRARSISTAYLEILGVANSEQGKGYGSQFLRGLEVIASAHGKTKLALTASSQRARAFYHNHDYWPPNVLYPYTLEKTISQ